MAYYTKNHNIDDWPICKDGEPLSKDSILGLLNGYEIANNLLAQERDSLQAQLDEALSERDKWKSRTESLANFNPDWDMLEASQRSLREYMSLLQDARAQIDAMRAQRERLREQLVRCHNAHTGVYPAQLDVCQAIRETSAQSLAAIEARAIEQFKNELLQSVKVIFRPHIEGVFAVVESRLRQQGKGE